MDKARTPKPENYDLIQELARQCPEAIKPVLFRAFLYLNTQELEAMRALLVVHYDQGVEEGRKLAAAATTEFLRSYLSKAHPED